MIRTLVVLTPGTKHDGARCLRGELSRDVVTTDEAGHERTYPRGTPLVLRCGKGDVYSLLALLPDDDLPEPAGRNTTRDVTTRRHFRQVEGDAIPF